MQSQEITLCGQNLLRLKHQFSLDDPYAKVSLNQLQYLQTTGMRGQPGHLQALKQLLQRGAEIVQKDELNCMGAAIVGVVLAELKYFEQAKQVLALSRFSTNCWSPTPATRSSCSTSATSSSCSATTRTPPRSTAAVSRTTSTRTSRWPGSSAGSCSSTGRRRLAP